MLQIKLVLAFIMLAIVTIGQMQAQQITSTQLDFSASTTSKQSSISKAMNWAIQKAEGVWLSNPNFKSHFAKEKVAMSPTRNAWYGCGN